MYYIEWDECTEIRVLFISVGTVDCKSKTSAEYIKKDCKDWKLQLLEDLKDKGDDAKKNQDCRRNSENNNKGLKYAGETPESDLKRDLDVGMDDTNFIIGKASEMESGDGCKPMPFTVNVTTLSSTSPGFTSSRKSESGTSSTCFKTEEDLINSFSNNLKTEVADKATDAARGSQGRDKDENLRQCSGTDECSLPRIEPKPNFKPVASVFCTQDFSKLNYQTTFGDVEAIVDSKCAARAARFRFLDSLPRLSCNPVELQVKRSARDCCGNEAFLMQTLQVVPLRPTITQPERSMDVTQACDADINPTVLGFPTFEAGCPNSDLQLSMDDVDALFDVTTCTSTIKRTFSVVENGCVNSKQTFEQIISLENNYNPEWDFFPEDRVVGVFDDYGTESQGFPTVFQRCGASPVQVTFSDSIEEGDCLFERVLKRRFKAVDVCGHVSERIQQITIVNNSGLPLGEKSLAKIYGRTKAKIGGGGGKGSNEKCLLTSEGCDLRLPLLPKPPTNGKGKGGGKMTESESPTSTTSPSRTPILDSSNEYKCETGLEHEFYSYQSRLAALHSNLDKGPTMKSCVCTDADPSCDARTVPDNKIMYGTKVTFAAGYCMPNTMMVPGNNRGHISIVKEQRSIPPSGKGINGGSPTFADVSKLKLVGTNQVYNIFDIRASSFSRTIEIDAPPLSVVLVNVYWEDQIKKSKGKGRGEGKRSSGRDNAPSTTPSVSVEPSTTSAPSPEPVYPDQNIEIGKYSDGIVLTGEGMVANNILWNVVGNGKVKIKLASNIHEEWSFSGSMMNSRGRMNVGKGKGKGERKPNIWRGQLFCDFVEAYNVNFKCGHFIGFASCEDIASPQPSQFPSVVPSDLPSVEPSISNNPSPSPSIVPSGLPSNAPSFSDPDIESTTTCSSAGLQSKVRILKYKFSFLCNESIRHTRT